jgi:murein DD-endopeptidase MepM/ murein hydrolase activator NlpD
VWQVLNMKKCMWLLLLLFELAALDVLGADRLLTGSHPARTTETDLKETTEDQITQELTVFPIPESVVHTDYTFSYEDSWMEERTYGGERSHEGTDIMLTPNTRGLFPVLSMTDGVVEKKGWLPLGGYRIGIRSSGGIYYYYAHLYDYAEDLEEGSAVTAGQLLGYAGDSGYSDVEGTVGNFPVHLHVGIYYDDPDTGETAVDPYEYLINLPIVTMNY